MHAQCPSCSWLLNLLAAPSTPIAAVCSQACYFIIISHTTTCWWDFNTQFMFYSCFQTRTKVIDGHKKPFNVLDRILRSFIYFSLVIFLVGEQHSLNAGDLHISLLRCPKKESIQKWRWHQKWRRPKRWRWPQKLALPSKFFCPPLPLPLKNYLKFFLMTSHRNSHTTTDIKPEMLSGVQTGNGTPHDKYNIRGIAHGRTNRKDDIFMQRRLEQNFTLIWKWGQGTCLLTKHTLRWAYSRYFTPACCLLRFAAFFLTLPSLKVSEKLPKITANWAIIWAMGNGKLSPVGPKILVF